MKRNSVIFFVALLTGFLFYGTVLSQEKEKEDVLLNVKRFAFCEKVEDREPVDAKKEFSTDVGKVYFWTSIYGAQQPTSIKHIWYYKDKKMFEQPLAVKYLRTRTWSCKNILPEWVGDWYVEVIDENGNVLGKYPFKIK